MKKKKTLNSREMRRRLGLDMKDLSDMFGKIQTMNSDLMKETGSDRLEIRKEDLERKIKENFTHLAKEMSGLGLNISPNVNIRSKK